MTPTAFYYKTSLLILAVLLFANLCMAFTADTSAAQTNSAAIPPAVQASQKEIKVIDVYKWGHQNSTDEDRNAAGIGDIIVIKVSNLTALLNKARCLNDSGKAKNDGCKKQEIRLFLDGRMINGLVPESGAPQADEGELQFHLERNNKNDETWADLLGAPEKGKFFKRPQTKVSIGLENDFAENTDINNFNLIRVRKSWFWTCLLGSAIYLVALFWLGAKKNLLRDRSVNTAAINVTPSGARPYSLGRFQMAFWFSLVILSFMFIWLITGAYDLITPGVLALIGISSGTSLSAIVIDSSKNTDLVNQTAALQAEEATLTTDIAALLAKGSPVGDKQARLQQVQATIKANIKTLTPSSEGFFKDLLSDVNGMSFHRLQMFVWTFVLGLIFIYSVWVRLAMPEFSATLLALQGITAGTYIGFKIPEKQA